LASLWQQLEAIQQQQIPPPIWFHRDHCTYCHWLRRCEQTAVEHLDLAALPHLHPKTAMALRKDGITTIPQLAKIHSSNLSLFYPNIGQHAARLHAAATALSTGEPVILHSNQPLQQSPISITTSHDASKPARSLFLDLETRGYEPWAFG